MRLTWLMVCGALLGPMTACGDDGDTTPPPGDGGGDVINLDGGNDDSGGTVNTCPSVAPDRDGLSGPCCFRTSNASQLDTPELRLSSLKITAPSTLSSAIVNGAIQAAIDEERFNWLIQLDLAGETPSLKTGFGARSAGPTFAFVVGGAPTDQGGAADRWDPVTATIAFADETMTGVDEVSTTLPIFEDDGGTTISLELPVSGLTLESGVLSHDRTCIGERGPTKYDTTQGALTAFVRVDDSMLGRVKIGETVDTTLCNLIRGEIGSEVPCTTVDRAEWFQAPDSFCDEGGCTKDPGNETICDLDTCNAWRIEGGFGAHGVDITN